MMQQWIAVSCHVQDHTARLLVGILEVKAKQITCHVLAPSSVEHFDTVAGQLEVIFSDLRWRVGAADASSPCLIIFDNLPRAWAQGLKGFVRENGHVWKEGSLEMTIDETIVSESVWSVVHKASSTHWASAPYAGLLLSTLYVSLVMVGNVIGNPSIENAIKLVAHDHGVPIRHTMRLDDLAQLAVKGHFLREGPPVISLLRKYCHSKRGAELAQQRLIAPETNLEEIKKRQDCLEEIIGLVKATEAFATRSVTLFNIVDDGDRRFQWFVCGLEKSTKVSPGLKDWRSFCNWIKSLRTEAIQLDNLVLSNVGSGSKVHRRITKSWIEKIAGIWEGFCLNTIEAILNFEASAGSDATTHDVSNLEGVRINLKRCEQMIHKHRDEVAAELLLQPDRVKIEEDEALSLQGLQSTQPILFRVTRQDAHRVIQAVARPTVTGFRQAHSRRTSGVWFTTHRLGTLVAERHGLLQALYSLEHQVISSLMATYNGVVRADVQEILSYATELDFLTSCAQLSICHSFVRPKLSDSRNLEIVGLRWPNGQTTTPAKSCDSSEMLFIGNSSGCDKILRLCPASPMLLLHSSVDDDASVLIRLALTVVLNQIGCFVPCASATLPVFDSLFFRAGAFDHIMKNQSTFMFEMEQLSKILTRASQKSLVLIDELCRGTSPSEGMPLAVEICQHLIENRLFTCVATQWTELVHTLLPNERVAVPTMKESDVREHSKALYIQRQTQCDHRFLASVHALEFPEELLEMLDEELQQR